MTENMFFLDSEHVSNGGNASPKIYYFYWTSSSGGNLPSQFPHKEYLCN